MGEVVLFLAGVLWGGALVFAYCVMRRKKIDKQFEALKGEVWREKDPQKFLVFLSEFRLFLISKNLLSNPSIYCFFQKHLTELFNPMADTNFPPSEYKISEIKHDLLKLEIC